MAESGAESWPEWSELWDETHQCYYYYNNYTGENVWDKPAGFDEAQARRCCCPSRRASNGVPWHPPLLVDAAFPPAPAARVCQFPAWTNSPLRPRAAQWAAEFSCAPPAPTPTTPQSAAFHHYG